MIQCLLIQKCFHNKIICANRQQTVNYEHPSTYAHKKSDAKLPLHALPVGKMKS